MSDAPTSARARVRAEIAAEIVEAARAELALTGAAGLSLRAVARRLGMVPSALYRYFPSRDSLLTALIVEAYEAVGAVAGDADPGPAAGALLRWLAVAAAVRRWAQENPHRWAVIYGSPVPGYEAPQTTVESALVITRVIAGIIPPDTAPVAAAFAEPPSGFDAVLEPTRSELLGGAPPQVVVGALLMWTTLLGMVSLELFGHYEGATADFGQVFAYSMETVGRLAGLR